MLALSQLLIHSFKNDINPTYYPRTADDSSLCQPMLYALVTVGILAVFILLGLTVWVLSHHHYRTMIAALHNDRDRAAELESGSFEHRYGTASERQSRTDRTSRQVPLKDDRDMDSVYSRLCTD